MPIFAPDSEVKYISGISFDLTCAGNFDVTVKKNRNKYLFQNFSCRLPFVNW